MCKETPTACFTPARNTSQAISIRDSAVSIDIPEKIFS